MSRRGWLSVLPVLPLAWVAQQESRTQAVIRVDGQDFATWQEYLSSPLFRRLGLRCGTRLDASVQEFRVPSDCSLGSTTIQAAYDPQGHALYQIPVVVHVLQNTGGLGQIPDEMIASQIDVLNEDFRALPGTLGELGHDTRIQFYLADVDPDGAPTSGITRTVSDSGFNDTGSYWDTLAWDATPGCTASLAAAARTRTSQYTRLDELRRVGSEVIQCHDLAQAGSLGPGVAHC